MTKISKYGGTPLAFVKGVQSVRPVATFLAVLQTIYSVIPSFWSHYNPKMVRKSPKIRKYGGIPLAEGYHLSKCYF